MLNQALGESISEVLMLHIIASRGPLLAVAWHSIIAIFSKSIYVLFIVPTIITTTSDIGRYVH